MKLLFSEYVNNFIQCYPTKYEALNDAKMLLEKFESSDDLYKKRDVLGMLLKAIVKNVINHIEPPSFDEDPK